jgi:hypothetical protein
MEGQGLLELDLRLSKALSPRIDKIIVEARHTTMEPVTGELAISGNIATGTLKVPAGSGWVITAKAYVGDALGYTGSSKAIDVVAGKSVEVPIELRLNGDLVAVEVLVTRPGGTEPIDPSSLVEGDEVDLNLKVRNTAPIAVEGWGSVSLMDGVGYSSGENHTIAANAVGFIYARWTAVAGEHTVRIVVDPDDKVKESDETNNTRSLTFTVRPSSPAIDLVAEEVFLTLVGYDQPIDPSSLVEGNEVRPTLRYRNAGAAAAPEWRVEAYLDGVLEASDVRSTAANSTGHVSFDWTATDGRHTVEFRLDTKDVVREADETNNTRSLTFTVQRSAPPKGIVAGNSVDGIQLGFNGEQVVAIAGNPSYVEDFWWSYDHLGIGVGFDEYGLVDWIEVIYPYSGTTERGIGLGATGAYIEALYGSDWTWDMEDGQFYAVYSGLGIAFAFDENGFCMLIAIFPR